MDKSFTLIVKLVYTLTLSFLIDVTFVDKAFSASASSSVTQVVSASASISKISDFKFVTSKSNKPNALFSLGGSADNTFTVTLPQKNITLKSSKPGKTIELRGFESSLKSTRIEKNGKKNLSISISKRPYLAKNDNSFYSGRVTVDIVY